MTGEFKIRFNDNGVFKVTVPNGTRVSQILIVGEDDKGMLFRPDAYTEDGGETFKTLWKAEVGGWGDSHE